MSFVIAIEEWYFLVVLNLFSIEKDEDNEETYTDFSLKKYG